MTNTKTEWVVRRKNQTGQWGTEWRYKSESEAVQLFDAWVKQFGKDMVRMIERTTTTTTTERVIE